MKSSSQLASGGLIWWRHSKKRQTLNSHPVKFQVGLIREFDRTAGGGVGGGGVGGGAGGGGGDNQVPHFVSLFAPHQEPNKHAMCRSFNAPSLFFLYPSYYLKKKKNDNVQSTPNGWTWVKRQKMDFNKEHNKGSICWYDVGLVISEYCSCLVHVSNCVTNLCNISWVIQ